MSHPSSVRVHHPRLVRASTSLALLFGIVGAAATGCGAAPPEQAASSKSDLDLSGYESASDVICHLVNDMPSFSVGDISFSSSGCQSNKYDNFYYLGSDYYRLELRGGPVESTRAATLANSLYCALKDSHGATANGTASTPLGAFGMSSRINVSKYDPTAMQVVGQRIGTLWAFGVPLDIEDQDYVATFPTEALKGGSVFSGFTTGHYMTLQTSTATWSIGGSGFIGPFTLSAKVGQQGYFSSMNNNLFGTNGGWQENNPNPGLTWSAWENSCKSCVPSWLIQCDCPSAAQTAQYNQFASWSSSQFENLTDGVLPYQGNTGGVSGNQVYLNSANNWTELGPAPGGLFPAIAAIGGTAGVAGDDTHTVGNNPSTYFDVSFGFDYGIINLDLDLQLDFSSSMELVQNDGELSDGPLAGSIMNNLYAQSTTQLSANLSVSNPFPFGPNPLIQETFNIINPTTAQPPATTAAWIQYDYTNGAPIYLYNTARTGNQGNPGAAEANCLAQPVQNNAPEAPASPQTWVQQVGNSAQANLFPCNVNLCNPSSNGSVSGTLETCSWNAATKSLACTQTNTPCSVCSDSVQLCDSSGHVYAPTSTTKYTAFCNAQ
jgi:hypothetical protein